MRSNITSKRSIQYIKGGIFMISHDNIISKQLFLDSKESLLEITLYRFSKLF